MERIKISSIGIAAEHAYDTHSEDSLVIQEVKKFLCEVDNRSFDQIRFKHEPTVNKICIDIVTGMIYPEYDDFITTIGKSKYADLFDLQ